MPNRYSIVGTQFTGVPKSFIDALKPGMIAHLVREPNNKHDSNAVAVWIEGKRVGYVPRRDNKVLAQFIDLNAKEIHQQQIIAQDSMMTEVNKMITGRFVRSPNSGFPMVEV